MKIAVEGGANPLGSVFWFALIATFVIALELAISRRLKLDLTLLRFCIPWAILSVILPNLFFFYAATEVQASIIALSIALVPMLTLSGAIVLRRERLTSGRATGIGLGALGVLMILLPEASLPDVADTPFVLIAFAGAACYAGEHLFIEARIPQNVGLDVLLFLMFLSATIVLFPAVWVTGSLFFPTWPIGLVELSIMSVAGVTLLDYFLITLLIVWAGPVFTSQAAYIVTLAGVVWGIVLFGETHSAWVWSAIVVLMAGLTFVRPRSAA